MAAANLSAVDVSVVVVDDDEAGVEVVLIVGVDVVSAVVDRGNSVVVDEAADVVSTVMFSVDKKNVLITIQIIIFEIY